MATITDILSDSSYVPSVDMTMMQSCIRALLSQLKELGKPGLEKTRFLKIF